MTAAIAIISVFTGLGIALWQTDVARTGRDYYCTKLVAATKNGADTLGLNDTGIL